jgi:hypothetical protein
MPVIPREPPALVPNLRNRRRGRYRATISSRETFWTSNTGNIMKDVNLIDDEDFGRKILLKEKIYYESGSKILEGCL